MPVLDMKVSELERYAGVNPKPKDHEQYWDKAIAQMRAVDPEVTMIPAAFQAPGIVCFDLYYTGVNHARIHAKFLRPEKVSGKIPAILKFHGYGYYSHPWSDSLAYAATGAAVFAMDVRGQGNGSEDVGGVQGATLHGHIIRGLIDTDPNKLLYRDIFLDAAELARIAMGMEFVDETRVYATGGSQGGGLTLACAALEPRVAKAAVVYPFLSDYKRVWDMDLARSGPYREIVEFFRANDPLHQYETEIFTKLGYIDVQHLASRVKAETWMFTGLMDSTCPPSTQYAAYNKLMCRKKHLLYPDFGHEELRDASDLVYEFLMNPIR